MTIRDLIHYGCDEAGVPELSNKIAIEWNNRFTRKIADANYFPYKQTGRIRISVKLWRTMSHDSRTDTILHEVAHVVDLYKNGHKFVNAQDKSGHGPSWQHIATSIGAKPERYASAESANFALFRRRTKFMTHTCSGCGTTIKLTQNRVTRMRRGTRYVCAKCKTLIKV